MADPGTQCATSSLGSEALRSLLAGTGGWELRVNPSLPGRPRLERDRFSGGVNLTRQARNLQRLNEATRVYRVASMPGVLFCAPWVYQLIKAEAGRG